MISNWMHKSLTFVISLALIASLFLTYQRLQQRPSTSERKDVVLTVTPDYQIISNKSLTVWPKGTVFEQGMAAYFYAALPQLTITPTIDVTGMDQGEVEGTIKTRVLLQAIDDKSQVYWSYQLKQTPKQSFHINTEKQEQERKIIHSAETISLDMAETNDLVTQISNELMFQNGIFRVVVVSDIAVNGQVNNGVIDKALSQELVITLMPLSFTLPRAMDASVEVAFTQMQVEEADASPSLWHFVRSNWWLISIDAVLALLLGLLLLFQHGQGNDDKEHQRYKEWITEGSVEQTNRFSIHILTLEGLVDLAIDLDKRVIYDSRVIKYYVLTEDIVYIYDRQYKDNVIGKHQQLGKLLLERGLIKPEQLEIGIYHQKKMGSKLGESLIALGFIEETTLYSTLAAQKGIDYYELNPDYAAKDFNWLDVMSIEQARTLMAVPLGIRGDGRLVIASSEATREGIKNALQDMFQQEIVLVAAKPSIIFETLKRFETIQKNKINQEDENNLDTPYSRLTDDEREDFIISYYRGKLIMNLFLKASGLIDKKVLSQVPEKEELLSWLVGKGYLKGEFPNLLKAFAYVIESMGLKERQEKEVPGILMVLKHAHYLTEDSIQWIEQELKLQGLSIQQLIINNLVASDDTIRHICFLRNVLSSILSNDIRML